MTLIEDREAFEPRILGKRTPERDVNSFDESGSDDEYSIANEGYADNRENNNRDFFSLPTLGLNYLNNLNLSLNLNLNLRNSSLWRIYENSPFPKSGFLSNYLGKHGEDGIDLSEHDLNNTDSRSYSTVANFLRHAFQSYEEDYSDEAILERVRFKELQRQADAKARPLMRKNFISDFHLNEKENSRLYSTDSIYDKHVETASEAVQEAKIVEERDIRAEVCKEDAEDMSLEKAPPYPNAFYHRTEVSTLNMIKMAILSIILLPIKLMFMIATLFMALLLVILGMYGMTFEESQSRPFPKWRRAIRWIIAHVVMRSFVFATGFVWSIKETGKRAEPEEAPILVVGPHSSYFDSFVVILLGAPSVVAKMSTKDVPVFGRLVTFTQAVYVSRESKGSRKQTMEVLKQRAQGIYHGSGMPQIFIFPEGTCSNRSSLIKFKPGAFVPQVPVQPVLIRYPNTFDPVTWTFDGVPILRNIWHALAQFYNTLEIEYLPVYKPSEEEKNNPSLFADNVRRVMAEALDIPSSEYQFEDGTLLGLLRERNLVQKMRSIHRAKKALGLSGCSYENATILRNNLRKSDIRWQFQQFQREFFHVASEDTTVPEVQAVFNSFKKDDEEDIDIRPYLILTSILYEDKSLPIHMLPKRICHLYNRSPNEVSEAEAKDMLNCVFGSDAETKSSDSRPGIGDGDSPINSESLNQLMSRHLEFAKLFADEVTDKLPKTYPSRSERDKPSPVKQKLN